MNKQKVIIVGCGAAALIAANELADDFNVHIIEASTHAGGRLLSVKEGDVSVEGGAEFIHGKLPLTLDLAKKAGLTLVKVKGRMMRKVGNSWKEQDDVIEGWDDLLKRMKDQPEHKTMQDFLEEHFGGSQFADLRDRVGTFAEGFDLASTSEISVKSLFREWSAEESQFRLKEGYSALVDYLVEEVTRKDCFVTLGDPVRTVSWSRSEVKVETLSGKIYHSEKLIVTIPAGVMSDEHAENAVEFSPALENISKAYRSIGFGPVVKVVLDFKDRLWKDDVGFMFTNEQIPTWWTQYPIQSNLLTGWAGGPAAVAIAKKTDDELAELALTIVSTLLGLKKSEIKNQVKRCYVFNWLKSPNILGAYSFSKPVSYAARKLLTTPISDTIYFAGEALFEGDYPGTVEAAFTSGRDVALRIKNSPALK